MVRRIACGGFHFFYYKCNDSPPFKVSEQESRWDNKAAL